ncbi:hypothetical protein ACH5RR_021691 [Cinchona calisaya]|uniref:Uncharacterized protein n=1 Tax=Cinchona calisaya TaxID=153742 RepID=A0ABD2ZI27_9GENT
MIDTSPLTLNSSATALSFNKAVHGLGTAANYSPVVLSVVDDYLENAQTSFAAAHKPHTATYDTGVATFVQNNVKVVRINVGVDKVAAKHVSVVNAPVESYRATVRTSSTVASFIQTSREVTEVIVVAAKFQGGATAQTKNTGTAVARGLSILFPSLTAAASCQSIVAQMGKKQKASAHILHDQTEAIPTIICLLAQVQGRKTTATQVERKRKKSQVP